MRESLKDVWEGLTAQYGINTVMSKGKGKQAVSFQ